ncbi:hypothetical protein CORT_0A09890 [Candida orthopsilosis Co 90-125]|uniref:Uncharacterized protein n=1 Tax=Candida orthopsilosis (strain 90-125) TaxID=1136231 RepID=H8WX69_CANO9|nr:hypothetical protein CORT_0A09890 [Candida orthopsilosis Co 90-125]CCG21374.1 hypothetical protein CORT_0A09890 [Candida orthopsilosis Co 90-125]
MTDHLQLSKRRKCNATKANQFMVKIPKSNMLEFDASDSDGSMNTTLFDEEQLHEENCTNFRNSVQLHVNSVSLNKNLKFTGYRKRIREVEITMTQNHDSSFDNSCPLNNPFITATQEKHPDVKGSVDLDSNVTFIKWCDELNSIQKKEKKLINQLYVERYKLYMRYDSLNKVLNKYASQLSAEESQLSEKFEHIKKTFSDILNLTV